MNGERVGTWSRSRATTQTFQYDEAWTQSPAARVLSLSLPFTPDNAPLRGNMVAWFFDNLLPDSDAIRSRLKSKYATDSTGAFDLLAAIGRDCVGAVQLLPEDETPQGYNRIVGEPLNDAGVERAIAAALSGARYLGQANTDDFRISIAGAQEKTALLFHQKKWWLPHGSTPTTHILKLPLGLVGNLQADMRDSVENEWLCSRIMQAFELETAHCEIAQFGERKVLVVERFDRAWQDNRWIARLPQEDFCQALGVPGELKYESDGGPGIRAVLRVLDASSQSKQDKRAFVKAQMVFWLLAATDAHAKNFSIFHQRGGTYRLTPLYDVLSAWPIIGRGPRLLDIHKARLAMAVRSKNAHWKLLEIQPRHWDSVAREAGLGDAKELMEELFDQTPKVLQSVGNQLPKQFPPPVSEAIFTGINEQIKRLHG